MIGRGGMGEVWAARHTVTRKRCALKLLAPKSELDPVAKRRMIREARAASRIDHPNVIAVQDLFIASEGPVMVMELLKGESLESIMRREAPMEVERAAELMLQIVSAVGAAHACGVVHRDLKPANVFVVDESLVKVLDFGIARELAAGDETTVDRVMGTPAYMAPEQHRAEQIDHRADVWALGVIIYELIGGQRPIDGSTSGEIVEHLLTDGIPPLRAIASWAPFDISITARRMLESNPDHRPDNLSSVLEVFRKHSDRDVPDIAPVSSIFPEEDDDPRDSAVTEAPLTLTPSVPPRRRRGLVGLSAAAIVALGAVTWLGLDNKDEDAAPRRPLPPALHPSTTRPPRLSLSRK